MNMRVTLLIARLEARLILTATFPFLLLIIMPIVVALFLSRGLTGGPSHAVPGLAAMFGLFGAPVVGLAFFRDHGWNTWDRLRASQAGSVDILLGKSLPLTALFVIQQLVLLFVGWAFLDMPWRGGVPETVLLLVSIVAVEASAGLLIVAFCRNIEELAVTGYLGALILSGLGGALEPISRLPLWMHEIAPASPVFWMEKGFRVVVVGDGSLATLIGSVAVLVAFALAIGLMAVLRYSSAARKTYFAA